MDNFIFSDDERPDVVEVFDAEFAESSAVLAMTERPVVGSSSGAAIAEI